MHAKPHFHVASKTSSIQTLGPNSEMFHRPASLVLHLFHGQLGCILIRDGLIITNLPSKTSSSWAPKGCLRLLRGVFQLRLLEIKGFNRLPW